MKTVSWLSTDYGMYYAKEIDWNMMKAMDKALDSLEKRIFEDKEKKLQRNRDPKFQAFMSRKKGLDLESEKD